MTLEKQKEIADSFSDKFEEFNLNLRLSKEEFDSFDNGVFSKSMDEKWNIFVLDNVMYWARSWTNFCIYKVIVDRQAGIVVLSKTLVTKDKSQYNSSDIQQDKIHLLRLIQAYLGRDDIYVDPEFEFDLIKQTLYKQDPNNECKKSIGHNNVGLTKQIHDGMTTEEQRKYYDVTGWTELKNNISSKPDNESLLSLYLQNKKTNSSVTYYFDEEAKQLLGQIMIKPRLSSS